MSDNEKTLALLAALVGVRTSGPRKVQRPRMADEVVRLRAENAALRAAVERVRALHDGERRHVGWIDVTCCRECSDDDNTYAYPCPPFARWRRGHE